jgi:head-tail adaptor
MREFAEKYTGRRFVDTDLELNLDCWPGHDRAPGRAGRRYRLRQISRYDGALQTLYDWSGSPQVGEDLVSIDLKSQPARIQPAWAASLADDLRGGDFNAVRIGFTAGYGTGGSPEDLAVIPAELKLWIRARLATLFENREAIIVGNIVAEIPRDLRRAARSARPRPEDRMNARVFIGFEPRERDAYLVAAHTLRKHASIPLEIEPLVLEHLRWKRLYSRPHEMREGRIWDSISGAPMATEFALTRFLVPHLAGYQRPRAFLRLRFPLSRRRRRAPRSAARIRAMPSSGRPACAQAGEETKMDGQIQTATRARIGRAACSGIARTRRTPARSSASIAGAASGCINSAGCRTRRSASCRPAGIGSRARSSSSGASRPIRRAVHFTRGIPSMPGYENVAFADEWRAALAEATRPRPRGLARSPSSWSACMRSGRLRRLLVEIARGGSPRQSSSGERLDAWSEFANVRAVIRPLSGASSARPTRRRSAIDVEIEIRYLAGVKGAGAMRVVAIRASPTRSMRRSIRICGKKLLLQCSSGVVNA